MSPGRAEHVLLDPLHLHHPQCLLEADRWAHSTQHTAQRAWWGWWWLCRYWCSSPRHRQDDRPRGEEICQILPVGLLLPLLPGRYIQVVWSSSAGVAFMFGWTDYVRIVPNWWLWWIMVHLNSQFILILLQSHSRMSPPGHHSSAHTRGLGFWDTFILALAWPGPGSPFCSFF